MDLVILSVGEEVGVDDGVDVTVDVTVEVCDAVTDAVLVADEDHDCALESAHSAAKRRLREAIERMKASAEGRAESRHGCA